jgi:hypothetical protein
MNLNDLNLNANETSGLLKNIELKKSTEGIPLYPAETENAVLVEQWASAFTDYAMSHQMKLTLATGRDPLIPGYIRKGLLSDDADVKKEAKKQRDELTLCRTTQGKSVNKENGIFPEEIPCPLREGGSSPSRPPPFEVLVVRATLGKPRAQPTPSPYESAFQALSDSCIAPLAP